MTRTEAFCKVLLAEVEAAIAKEECFVRECEATIKYLRNQIAGLAPVAPGGIVTPPEP